MELELADEEIVAEVRAGRTPAFAVLMRRYNQRLYRTARAILRDDGEAEDVLQETYFRALAGLASFRAEAQLGTWLTRIAVHEACARLRGRRRVHAVSEIAVARAAVVTTPERSAYDDELRRALEAAIDALPDGLRTVFVLRVLEGLSTAETADILDISVISAKVRLYRARAALRRRLSLSLDVVAADAFAFGGARCARPVEAVLGAAARA